MNKNSQLITLALVTATAGLAAFGLTNTEFAARLPLDAFLATTVTLGLIRFAFSDYSRRVKPLSVPAAILRPVPFRTVRVSAHVERIAA